MQNCSRSIANYCFKHKNLVGFKVLRPLTPHCRLCPLDRCWGLCPEPRYIGSRSRARYVYIIFKILRIGPDHNYSHVSALWFGSAASCSSVRFGSVRFGVRLYSSYSCVVAGGLWARPTCTSCTCLLKAPSHYERRLREITDSDINSQSTNLLIIYICCRSAILTTNYQSVIILYAEDLYVVGL